MNRTVLDNGFLEYEVIFQELSNSTWVNFGKWRYTYDNNNNLIENLQLDWEGTEWENTGKTIYTYDANNN